MAVKGYDTDSHVKQKEKIPTEGVGANVKDLRFYPDVQSKCQESKERQKEKRREMSRELWDWIATGDEWLGKCSTQRVYKVYKEYKRSIQREMSGELWDWIATGGAWESNGSNGSPHPLISLDSQPQNSPSVFGNNSKFLFIILFANQPRIKLIIMYKS